MFYFCENDKKMQRLSTTRRLIQRPILFKWNQLRYLQSNHVDFASLQHGNDTIHLSEQCYIHQEPIHLNISCERDRNVHIVGSGDGGILICAPEFHLSFNGHSCVQFTMSNITLVSHEIIETHLKRLFQQRLIKGDQLIKFNIYGNGKSTIHIDNSRILAHVHAEKLFNLKFTNNEINRFHLTDCNNVTIQRSTLGNLFGEGYTTNDLRIQSCSDIRLVDNEVWYSTLSLESVMGECSVEGNRIRSTRPGIRVDSNSGQINISNNSLFDAGIHIQNNSLTNITNNTIGGVECALNIQQSPSNKLNISGNTLKTKPCLNLNESNRENISISGNTIHCNPSNNVSDYILCNEPQWFEKISNENTIIHSYSTICYSKTRCLK
jgi:hypothetical protein